MIIDPTVQIGDPVIRRVAKPVPRTALVAKQTKTMIKNLVDSMRYHNLIGMAAPQIGIGARVFVTELRETNVRRIEKDRVRVFVNPVILRSSKEKEFGGEGCGSVAHGKLFGSVSRPARVTVTALNEKGARFTLTAEGLLARVIQHETDHLNGMVFLDRMKDMKSLIMRE